MAGDSAAAWKVCLLQLCDDPIWKAQSSDLVVESILSVSPGVRCKSPSQGMLGSSTAHEVHPPPTKLALRDSLVSKDSSGLRRLVAKELDLGDFLSNVQTDVRPYMRADLLGWLMALNEHFQFSEEVFSLTCVFLDMFLCKTKVKPKYLHCLGVACFLVASKVVEEDFTQPSLEELEANSGFAFTTNDIKRMERIVCTKLNWELTPTTGYGVLSEMVVCLSDRRLAGLDRAKLLSDCFELCNKCVLHYQLAQLSPSKLAIAVLSHVMVSSLGLKAEPAIEYLQETINLPQQELDRCVELVDCFLVTKARMDRQAASSPEPARASHAAANDQQERGLA